MMEIGADKPDGWGKWDDEIADRRVDYIAESIKGGRRFTKGLWRGGDAEETLYDHELATEAKEVKKRKRSEVSTRGGAVAGPVLKQKRVSGYFRRPALVGDDRYDAIEARVVHLEKVVERMKRQLGKRKRKGVTPRKELLSSGKVLKKKRKSREPEPVTDSSSDEDEQVNGDEGQPGGETDAFDLGLPDQEGGGNRYEYGGQTETGGSGERIADSLVEEGTNVDELGGENDADAPASGSRQSKADSVAGEGINSDEHGGHTGSDELESVSGDPKVEGDGADGASSGDSKEESGSEDDEGSVKEAENELVDEDGSSSDEHPPILVPLKEGDGVPRQWVEEGVSDHHGGVLYRATTSSTYYVAGEKVS